MRATGALLSAEGGSDIFRLALTGGIGIMAFTILNAVLVGAVARGNWQFFEDEAAAWVDEDAGISSVRASLMSDDELDEPEEESNVRASLLSDDELGAPESKQYAEGE